MTSVEPWKQNVSQWRSKTNNSDDVLIYTSVMIYVYAILANNYQLLVSLKTLQSLNLDSHSTNWQHTT